MTAFTPRRDDGRSDARVVADYLSGRLAAGDLAIDDIVSHKDLLDCLDIPEPQPGEPIPARYYQAVGAAIRLLQREQGRSLETIRGEGYRLIAGMAQVGKSRGQQTRAKRQLSKAVATADTTDMSLIPPEQRSLARAVQHGMSNLHRIVSVQAERLAAHDEMIRELKTERVRDRAVVEATSEQVADMQKRLHDLEEKLTVNAQMRAIEAATPPVPRPAEAADDAGRGGWLDPWTPPEKKT